MAKKDFKLALVTGSNRGLGFAAAKQLAAKGVEVIISSRDAEKGKQAIEKIKKEIPSAKLHFHELDVTNSQSIEKIYEFIKMEFGKLDILINNAGIFLDGYEDKIFQTPVESVLKTFQSNVLGAFQLSQKFVPMMINHGFGRIVNVSSGLGQLSEMGGGFASYRISKTALNAVTRMFAAETGTEDVLVNSMCPGWCKTDMGGPGADRSPEEGAETMVWLALLPAGADKTKFNGQFFRDKEKIDW